MGYSAKDKQYNEYIKSLKKYEKLSSQDLDNLVVHALELLSGTFNDSYMNYNKQSKLTAMQKDFIIVALDVYSYKKNESLIRLIPEGLFKEYNSLKEERLRYKQKLLLRRTDLRHIEAYNDNILYKKKT